MFNIVLVEPRIPQNTGNIARTCAATGCGLHIVRPTAFQITDKNLKRAGLDYWHLLNVQYYDNLKDFFEKTEGARYFYATTKAQHTYVDAEELLYEHEERCIRIPMIDEARSLNLSNSVAIVVYEALRQQGFDNLKNLGQLTKFKW